MISLKEFLEFKGGSMSIKKCEWCGIYFVPSIVQTGISEAECCSEKCKQVFLEEKENKSVIGEN